MYKVLYKKCLFDAHNKRLFLKSNMAAFCFTVGFFFYSHVFPEFLTGYCPSFFFFDVLFFSTGMNI